MSERKSWPVIALQGIEIDAVGEESLHPYIRRAVRDGRKSRILNVNIRAMNIAARDPEFYRILSSAEIVFCDGAGVQLAARLRGLTVPPRITYARWIWQLASFCERQGLTLFLLGAEEGVAELAASQLKKRHPELEIRGARHGYFDHFGSDALDVIRDINSQEPDILLVCFGMPLQEKWIAEYWTEIDANVFLCGGACLDYTAGIVERGPDWMTENGLEWLYRLSQQPARLWPRTARVPQFFARIIREGLTGSLR